jgi:hypothetical protein
MTPEQEERLGQLMATRARQEGHIQKFPVDVRTLSITAGEEDTKNLPLIYAYLKQVGEPKFRFQIIQNVNASIRSIDRCLKTLDEAGQIQRTRLGSDHIRWQVVK